MYESPDEESNLDYLTEENRASVPPEVIYSTDNTRNNFDYRAYKDRNSPRQ